MNLLKLTATVVLVAGWVSEVPAQQPASAKCDRADQLCIFEDSLVTSHCVGDHGWGTYSCSPDEKYKRQTNFYQSLLTYNENGEPGDNNQRDTIIKKIRDLSKGGTPLLVVVYVHGWRHSASKADNNVVKFYDLLARHHDAVRRQFEISANATNKATIPTVLGIYVGWPGDLPTQEPCKLKSLGSKIGLRDKADLACNFFERSTVADRIARKGIDQPCTEGTTSTDFGCDLRAIAKEISGSSNRLIVYGHSLGGRMLTSAFLPSFVAARSAPLGPRSLIVTINAAVGADCYFPAYRPQNVWLNDIRPPQWINITSDDDDTTKSTYAWARTFPGLKYAPACNEAVPDSASRDKTIGHYRKYVTHELHYYSIYAEQAENERYKNKTGIKWKDKEQKNRERILAAAARLKPPQIRNTSWFVKPTSSHLLGFPYRDKTCTESKICYNEKNPEEYYMELTSNTKISPAFGHFERLFNIITDKKSIDYGPQPPLGDAGPGSHNGYVQTLLTRLIVELAYSSAD